MSENLLYPNVDPKKINITPEEFTLNDLGVIKLDANYDILSLQHSGKYFCPNLGAQAPLVGMGACIDVHPTTELDRVIVIHYRHNNTSWQRAMYNGVWGDWKLIAGKVLLWSGTASTEGTKITLQHDINRFGSLSISTPADWDLSTYIGDGTDLMFCGAFNQSSGYNFLLICLMQINNPKNLTLPNPATAVQLKQGLGVETIKLIITKIYGRP